MHRNCCGWAVLLGVTLALYVFSAHGAAATDAPAITEDIDAEATDAPAITEEEEDIDAEAVVTRSCTLITSGDGCIFDLTATAGGTLKVATKAAIAGQRWRTTIVEESVAGAVSTVGTGSTTGFTGLGQKSIVSGKKYDVFITYNSPLPGTLPTSVQIRFDGPVTVSGPRAISGSPETIRSCSQVSESGLTEAVDVETITCGTLMTCAVNPAGDTDAFKFNAPAGGAASISIARKPGSVGTPLWKLFSPSGGPLTGWVSGVGSVGLPTTGTYTIEVAESNLDQPVDYTLSLQGVSQSFGCGIPMAFGDLKSGKIDKEADTDTFRFSATAGNVVSISIARKPGSAGTPLWKLFSPSGGPLTGWVSGVGPVGLPTTGTYTIEVAESNLDQPGDYTLSLQKVK